MKDNSYKWTMKSVSWLSAFMSHFSIGFFLFQTPAEVTNLYAELGTCSFFPGSLSAHFLTKECYRSSAHFADFQVRSSLNHSKKNSSLLLEKSAETQNRS